MQNYAYFAFVRLQGQGQGQGRTQASLEVYLSYVPGLEPFAAGHEIKSKSFSGARPSTGGHQNSPPSQGPVLEAAEESPLSSHPGMVLTQLRAACLPVAAAAEDPERGAEVGRKVVQAVLENLGLNPAQAQACLAGFHGPTVNFLQLAEELARRACVKVGIQLLVSNRCREHMQMLSCGGSLGCKG